MRISEAAQRLGISPRMLRYREDLGLLPQVRPTRRTPNPAPARPEFSPPAPAAPAPAHSAAARSGAPRHRQFTAADLDAAGLGLAIEDRYDISPAALAFGLRVLADPRAAALVTDFGRRIGRISPPPARALDFEQERALRLLGLSPAAPPVTRGRPRWSPTLPSVPPRPPKPPRPLEPPAPPEPLPVAPGSAGKMSAATDTDPAPARPRPSAYRAGGGRLGPAGGRKESGRAPGPPGPPLRIRPPSAPGQEPT